MSANESEPRKTYVFVREEAYAIVRGQGRPMQVTGADGKQKRGPAKWSAQDVIGEALRWNEGAYLAHFPPSSGRVICAPEYVPGVGVAPLQIRAWLKRFAAKVRAMITPASTEGGKPRKQRIDTPVLLSVVASFAEDKSARPTEEEFIKLPIDEQRRISREIIAARRETMLTDDFIRWRELTLDWVQARYAAHLLAAVIHLDEENLHMHVLLHRDGLTVKPLLAGHIEATAVAAADGTRKQMQAAHNAAKRALIDQFHLAVGIKCGFSRKSPHPRGRKSAVKHKLEVAERLAEYERREAEKESRRIKAAAELEAQTIIVNARRRANAALAKASDLIQQAWEGSKREMAKRLEAELDEIQDREARWRTLLEELVPEPDVQEGLLRKHSLLAPSGVRINAKR